MKTATKNHRRPHRTREQLAHTSRVGVLFARRTFRLGALDQSIAILDHADQQPAGRLLAQLAWTLSIGASIAHEAEPGGADARLLAAALRLVVATSERGNLWRASAADVIATAYSRACHHLQAAPVQTNGAAMLETAEALASLVQAGVMRQELLELPAIYDTPNPTAAAGTAANPTPEN